MKSRRLLIEVTIAAFTIFILLWIMVPKFYRANHLNRAKYFPDPQLRESAALTLGFDADGFFTHEDAEAFTGDLRVADCTDLKGIEFFSNLSKIVIESDTIEVFDFTMRPKLESIIITAHNLVTVNTSNNPHLKYLELKVDARKRTINKLCKFDLTQNTELKIVSLISTDVKTLDLSQCPELNKLEVINRINASMVGLRGIDLSANTKLETLRLIKNPLYELDVSNLVELKTLECPGNRITNLDISTLKQLEVLMCQSNRLTNLDVSNNPKLQKVLVHENPLQRIDFPDQTNYQSFLLNRIPLDEETVSALKTRKINYKWMDFPRP